MEGKTHLVGGVVAGLGMATVTNFDPLLLIGAAAVGSLVPDIDHAKSKISKSSPLLGLVSAAVNVLFTHRTFTHSLLFLGLAAWLMSALSVHPAISTGLLIGAASHLFLDAVTRQGIKLFYPFKTTFKIPLNIRTGGKVEKLVLVALSVLGIYWGMDILGFQI